MRTRQALRIVALATLLAVAGLSVAQDDPAAPFTQAQADRGAATFAASCASCHGAELEGMAHFPALAGPSFQTEWAGKTVAELHTYIHTNMPLGQGGSLSDQEYLDLVAFLLAANGAVPDGSGTELTADALEGIVLAAPTAD